MISTPLQWVLNGRIIQNNSAPLHSRDPDQVYVIEDLALAEGSLSVHVHVHWVLSEAVFIALFD